MALSLRCLCVRENSEASASAFSLCENCSILLPAGQEQTKEMCLPTFSPESSQREHLMPTSLFVNLVLKPSVSDVASHPVELLSRPGNSESFDKLKLIQKDNPLLHLEVVGVLPHQADGMAEKNHERGVRIGLVLLPFYAKETQPLKLL